VEEFEVQRRGSLRILLLEAFGQDFLSSSKQILPMTWMAAASESALPRHCVIVCDVADASCDDVAFAHMVVDDAQEDGVARLSVICQRRPASAYVISYSMRTA
jgi:hypothetical protein